MNMKRSHRHKCATVALLAAIFLGASSAAHADEREDLEKLRATVLGLIDVLVKTGVIPRDKTDAMMREAEARANSRLAQMPPPEVGPDGKKIVRVAYVPEAVKVQMRDQIKAEVLAETKSERQADSEAFGSSSRIQIEGDLRLRAEDARLNAGNTPANALSFANPNLTRAADIWGNVGNGGIHNFNTQEDATRERLRARLGVTAKVSDTVSAGVAISTGNTTAPTSTNQTMAQGAAQTPGYFNKYSLVVDRAYVAYDPESWLSMSGGRFRNPFFKTDLVWADDLNFEGFAMSLKPRLSPATSAFFTAGWFPLAVNNPNQSHGRNLVGLQTGFDWQIGQKENRIKLAAALYDYHGIEGVQETQASFQSAPDYVVRSEYGAAYRQRGNTLFRINAPGSVDSATNWGLASAFRELNLTATVDVAQFDPIHVVLTGDLVKNIGFKRDDIMRRTGASIQDGHSLGYMGRIQVGAAQIAKRGDWNVSLAYRYLGSDAVLDAFTNSDFGLGGTNNKGTILGANYGIGKNTWLTARWLSSDLIDSMVPATSGASLKTKFQVDVFQLDLNAKF